MNGRVYDPTGLRRLETIRLTAADLDFAGDAVSVRATVVGKDFESHARCLQKQ